MRFHGHRVRSWTGAKQLSAKSYFMSRLKNFQWQPDHAEPDYPDGKLLLIRNRRLNYIGVKRTLKLPMQLRSMQKEIT
jgi:hypothetical protein